MALPSPGYDEIQQWHVKQGFGFLNSIANKWNPNKTKCPQYFSIPQEHVVVSGLVIALTWFHSHLPDYHSSGVP